MGRWDIGITAAVFLLVGSTVGAQPRFSSDQAPPARVQLWSIQYASGQPDGYRALTPAEVAHYGRTYGPALYEDATYWSYGSMAPGSLQPRFLRDRSAENRGVPYYMVRFHYRQRDGKEKWLDAVLDNGRLRCISHSSNTCGTPMNKVTWAAKQKEDRRLAEERRQSDAKAAARYRALQDCLDWARTRLDQANCRSVYGD